uniref:Uncharacterized protein n=1 Tax=Parastrongyloides trichosuri TaxID=131310 RepID=A0A0N4ZYM1_PARTI
MNCKDDAMSKKLRRSLMKFKPTINEIVRDIVKKDINDVMKYKRIESFLDTSEILKPYMIELANLYDRKEKENNNDITYVELAELTFKEELLRTLIITLRNELGNLYETMNKKNLIFPEKSTWNGKSVVKHIKKIIF